MAELDRQRINHYINILRILCPQVLLYAAWPIFWQEALHLMNLSAQLQLALTRVAF